MLKNLYNRLNLSQEDFKKMLLKKNYSFEEIKEN